MRARPRSTTSYDPRRAERPLAELFAAAEGFHFGDRLGRRYDARLLRPRAPHLAAAGGAAGAGSNYTGPTAAGGPGGATDSVTSFIVREYRDRSNVGYGTLLSFVYLIFIVILMTILIRFVNRWLQRAS